MMKSLRRQVSVEVKQGIRKYPSAVKKPSLHQNFLNHSESFLGGHLLPEYPVNGCRNRYFGLYQLGPSHWGQILVKSFLGN